MSGKLNIALFLGLFILVVLVLIDHWQYTRQMAALNRILVTLQERLGQPQAAVVVAPSASPTQAVQPTAPGAGKEPFPPPDMRAYEALDANGLPKEGVNFLLPARSYFRPELAGGTLTTYGETPKGLNSLLENAFTNTQIDRMVTDSLCKRDPVQLDRFRASLAERCIISEDWKVYTFHLRRGVMWQVPPLAAEKPFLAKPVELTAEDFVFAIRMIQDPNVACGPLRNYYEKLTKAEAVDRYTLRLTWSEKLYTNVDASLRLDPLPLHIYTVDESGNPRAASDQGVAFNKHWFDLAKQHIGVGPYRLVRYEPDSILELERNAAYWGGTEHFQKIVWNLRVKDPQAELAGFKNGQVQVHGLRPSQFRSEILEGGEKRFAPVDPQDPKAGRRGELGWEKIKRLTYFYLGWNLRRPILADRRVRQALSHAFPRERLIKEVFCGLGQPINTDVHPDTPYYHKDLPAYDFNPAKAGRLLAEAGWTDSDGDGWLDRQIDGVKTTLRIAMKTGDSNPDMDKALAIYREELRKLGLDLQTQPLEWKAMLKALEDRDFDGVVGGWAMDFDCDFVQLWDSKEADNPTGSNHCGFKDPEVDRLAQELRRTFDQPERIRIARQVQAILHREQPYTFFMTSEGIFLWQNQASQGRQALAGVVWSLDYLHPFASRFCRSRLTWHFQP